MELWENVILTGYLLWGSWYDIRKRAVPVGVLFLGGVLAVMVIVWKGLSHYFPEFCCCFCQRQQRKSVRRMVSYWR
jgi:ABC-type phosphate transport system auxiliary subunit